MVSLMCFEQSYSGHYKHCPTTAGQIVTDRHRRLASGRNRNVAGTANRIPVSVWSWLSYLSQTKGDGPGRRFVEQGTREQGLGVLSER